MYPISIDWSEIDVPLAGGETEHLTFYRYRTDTNCEVIGTSWELQDGLDTPLFYPAMNAGGYPCGGLTFHRILGKVTSSGDRFAGHVFRSAVSPEEGDVVVGEVELTRIEESKAMQFLSGQLSLPKPPSDWRRSYSAGYVVYRDGLASLGVIETTRLDSGVKAHQRFELSGKQDSLGKMAMAGLLRIPTLANPDEIKSVQMRGTASSSKIQGSIVEVIGQESGAWLGDFSLE